MGKNKRGFNWKSRQVVKGTVDDSETQKLMTKIEFVNEDTRTHENDTNTLVLPSKKRRFIKEKPGPEASRLLSKKKRKQLERIVDQKRKKAQRVQLIEDLRSVQVDPSELEQMTSLSSIQTMGLKRQFAEDELRKQIQVTKVDEMEVPVIKKMKFKKLIPKEMIKKDDPDVLGFSSPSSSSSSSSSEDESDLKSEMETPEEVKEVEAQKIEERAERENDKKDEIKREKLKDNNEVPISRKTVFVPVNRTREVIEAREKLPINAEEQVIMETINQHPVVILAGETGSGKTTQVPQFLYEAGYANDGKIIGITEPRRVAAMSMSKRVAYEMNLSSKEVSYQIRFEGNVTEETKIKFMTDGVLLREIEKDFLLSKYSAIILDEAHERSVYTDILIGLLSRIVPKRNKNGDPLKMIIMSATLRVEDFTQNGRLFKTPPPVLKVETRQFDVSAHFNRRTPEDYMAEAFKKVCKIHRTLPDGGILVFLTGQQEVNTFVKNLRQIFPYEGLEDDVDDEDEKEMNIDRGLKKALSKRKTTKDLKKKSVSTELPKIDLDDYNILPHDDTETDAAVDDDPDLNLCESEVEIGSNGNNPPMWALPLYSLLSSERQAKIFEPVPKGCRLCVVSTNVAETSLTIPGIKYVVDTGKVKTKFYDKVTGVSTYHVTYTSKAQANQRAGRAGRIGPGHCYRLYSSSVFENEFEDHAVPEIQKRPVEDLVLQMKAMHMDNVINFPFPTPPDLVQLKAAEKKLIALGALEGPPPNLSMKESQKFMFKSKITKLGKAIATFPLAPKFGKMLALSHQHDLLPYTITLVAALSVQEVLVETPVGMSSSSLNKAELMKLRRIWAGQGNSLLLGDPMVLLKAVGAAEYAGLTQDFCNRNGLRYKAMMEIRKLRRQLTNEVNLVLPHLNLVMDPSMAPPSDLQAKLLRQIILAGCPDQVAKKIESSDNKLKYAYRVGAMEDPVFLHGNCILRSSNPLPEWVVFQEVFETKGKMFLRGVTAVDGEWLPVFASRQCSFGLPLEKPPPFTDGNSIFCYVNGTYNSWDLPPALKIEYPRGIDRTKHFAKFLLEGLILEKLKEWTPHLLSPPLIMTKTWLSLQPRTEGLLKELHANDVDSKDKLLKIFEQNPNFLKGSYLKWIPESMQEGVTKS